MENREITGAVIVGACCFAVIYLLGRISKYAAGISSVGVCLCYNIAMPREIRIDLSKFVRKLFLIREQIDRMDVRRSELNQWPLQAGKFGKN
ncbi:MAG: hypothetical protein EHM35_06885 [Planctomycetaceae bacterium]|nr:MAG: hypothetical protein EHM35_06885 [Planctomycetaceae bacterium]